MKKMIVCCSFALLIGLGLVFYEPIKQRPDVTVCSFVLLADGLGKQGVEFLECVKDTYSASFCFTRNKNTRYSKRIKNEELKKLPKDLQKIIKTKTDLVGKVVVFEDALYYPKAPYYQIMEQIDRDDSICIAYSMLESTKIPGEWITILNSMFDAVVVPDPFFVEVYQSSGVLIPIFTLPLTVDLDDLLALPIKKEANRPFVFSNLASFSDRKNQEVLVQAFIKTFKNQEDVKLHLNCRYFQSDYLAKIEDLLRKENITNIELSKQNLSRQNYLNALKETDCYVNISKGEGFSIQPREAMALGIPVILSDNSAQKTICQTALVRSVPTDHYIPAVYYVGIQAGLFAEVSLEEVSKALLDVYENYDQYLALSEKSRQWAKKYTKERLKPLYQTLVHPNKIELSTENKLEEGTIYTTSRSLAQKYQKIIGIL